MNFHAGAMDTPWEETRDELHHRLNLEHTWKPWRKREHHLNVPETENSWELGDAICHRTSAENQFQ